MPAEKGPQLFLFEKLPVPDLDFVPLPKEWIDDPVGMPFVHAYRMLVPSPCVRNHRCRDPTEASWHTPGLVWQRPTCLFGGPSEVPKWLNAPSYHYKAGIDYKETKTEPAAASPAPERDAGGRTASAE